MEITLIGWIIIPISVYYFILKPKSLLYLVIFFIPFTSTAAFIWGGAQNSQSVPISLFLLAILVVRYGIDLIFYPIIKFKDIRPIYFLLILIIIIIFSLIMPVVIDGKLTIMDRYSTTVMYSDYIPLKFRTHNITQSIYFMLGAIFSIIIVAKSRDINSIKGFVSIYILSSCFVIMFGWWELIGYFTPLDYPRFMFNHMGLSGKVGYLDKTGFPRISSVALEPAVLVKQLLPLIPFVFWSVYSKIGFFNKKKYNMIILVGLLSLLFISKSTTSIVGLVVFFALTLFSTIKQNKIRIVYSLVVLTILILATLLIPYFIEYFGHKASSFSAIERFTTVKLGLQYFLKYPILGIGWGSYPTYDLIASILAGSGILGFTVFFSLITYILYKLNRAKKILVSIDQNSSYRFLIIAFSHSLILQLVINQSSGFNYYNQSFWFILGITIAFANIIWGVAIKKLSETTNPITSS